MDWREEQSLEVEALQSIYGDDFTEISDEPRSYNILLEPVAGAGEEQNHVAVTMTVTCSDKYPATDPPQLIIEAVRGLQERHIDHLQDLADRAAVAAIGEVSVFNICEAIKEWLNDNNKPELTMHEEMEERMRLEEEEENEIEEVKAREPKPILPSPLGIPPGTLVTSESFADWKRRFDEEQAAIRLAAEMAAGPKPENRLSGKQLFLQNLAQELEDEDAAPEDTEKKDVFWFNDELYSKEELPEDDDDEEDEPNHEKRDESPTTITSTSTSTPTSKSAITTSSTSSKSATTATNKPAPAKSSPTSASSSSSKPAASASTSKPAATAPSKAATSSSTSSSSSQPAKKPAADQKSKAAPATGKNAPAAGGKGGKKK